MPHPADSGTEPLVFLLVSSCVRAMRQVTAACVCCLLVVALATTALANTKYWGTEDGE